MKPLFGLLVAGLVFSSTAALAQDFEVPFDLPSGTTIDLVIDKSREDIRGGQTTRSGGVFRYRQTLTATDEGYRVRQVMTGMEGVAATREVSDLIAGASDISYDAGEDLAPLRIVDWPATVERITATVAKTSPDTPASALDSTRKLLLSMPPEQAAMVTLKEQYYLSATQFASLALGAPQVADEALPNPLGGPPIASTFTVDLKSIDRKAGLAVVHTRQELDPASTKASMQVAFARMLAGLPAGAPKPADADVAGLDMKRTMDCAYDMDMKTGLTAKADCKMVTVIASGGETATRNERWVITQTLVSKP